MVTPAEDDVKKMWQRLDERYGSRLKLVDAIVGDLIKWKTVKEGEDKALVELIDLIESSLRSLEKEGLQKEMSNSRVVGELEKKLPESVFRRWVHYMHDSKNGVQEEDRMEGLMTFLEDERKGIEYTMESLRSHKVQSRSSNPILTSNVHKEPAQACLLHYGAQHRTEDCKVYQGKNVNERIDLLKEKRACFRCLGTGHGVVRCREKGACGKEGCRRTHHPSIHFEKRCSKPAEITGHCFQARESGCMLQAMLLNTRCREKLNVVFDSAATSSIVTFEAAKKLRAKGKATRIALTKIGGEETEMDTVQYQINLIDEEGKELRILAYGIDKISTGLEHQDIDKLARILGVKSSSIQRPTGEVELLIGFEYAGFHPQKIKQAGHLVLLESRFGWCVGGSHQCCKREEACILNTCQILAKGELNQFLTIESMGVNCQPKCGSCKCGRCLWDRITTR